MEDAYYPADLAFAELSLDRRRAVLAKVFARLQYDERAGLIANPERLGLMVEAHCYGLRRFEELARYLQPPCLSRLTALVEETLLARLPNVA